MTFRIVAMAPFALNLAKPSDSFERVFGEMVRLGEAERILKRCETRPNSSSGQSRDQYLDVQAELIKNLRSDVQSAGLTPPLDLAQAMIQVRRDNKSPSSDTVGKNATTSITVNELLRQSGWPNNSESVFRQLVEKVDTSCN